MAWSAPISATPGLLFTAAQFNTYVRDNLLETMPGKATTPGRWFLTSGLNAIVQRAIEQDTVNTSQTTSSTTPVDLATVGPQVTVTTGTRALVFWRAQYSNSTADNYGIVSPAVSGATTIAASDDVALVLTSATTSDIYACGYAQMYTTLTAGSNTFTCKYRVQGGTGSFSRRQMLVMAM